MTAFSSAAAIAAMEVAVTTALFLAAAVPELSSASAAKGGDAFFVALMCLDTRVAVVALDLDGGGMMMMK